MDPLELFKYLIIAGIGFFFGRITMALQMAAAKKKVGKDLNKK